MKQFYQVRLERPAESGEGVSVMTAWIEAKGAKVGADVELLPSGHFWTVTAVYNRIPEDMLKEVQQQRRTPPPSIRDTVKDQRQAAR